MPTAICDCGKVRHWRNQRGTRLADLRCECGRPLRRAVYTPDGWRPAPAEGATKGRKMECCALCGRRRSVPGGGRRLEQAQSFQVYRRAGGIWEAARRETVMVPAGAVVCRFHSPDYPVFLPPQP